MQKRFTENDLYYQILRDFNRYVQRNYEPKSDAEWDRVVEDAGKTFCKYRNTEFYDFVLDLLNAHFKDCERRMKK